MSPVKEAEDFSCVMSMSIFQIVAGKIIAFITARVAGGDQQKIKS